MKKLLSIFIIALGLSSIEVNAMRLATGKKNRMGSCNTCKPCSPRRAKAISKGSCCKAKTARKTKRSCSNGKCNI